MCGLTTILTVGNKTQWRVSFKTQSITNEVSNLSLQVCKFPKQV